MNEDDTWEVELLSVVPASSLRLLSMKQNEVLVLLVSTESFCTVYDLPFRVSVTLVPVVEQLARVKFIIVS